MPKTRTDLDQRHATMSMAHEREDVQQVPLNRIRTDGGTQMREALDEATVADYAEVINDGREFTTNPEVYYDGTDYWLVDGFHRVAAYRQVYKELKVTPGAIDCHVRPGTRREAVHAATGANQDHGLRRSNATKRNAVETHLRDAEWSQHSDRDIANITGVHHSTVSRIRKELERTGAMRQSTERIGADGRKIDTLGIAAANADRHKPERPAPQPIRQPRPTPAPEPTPPTYTSEARTQYTTAQDGAQTALRAAANRIPARERKIATLRRVDEMCDLMIDHLTDYESGTGDYDTSHEARKLLRRMQNTARRHLAAYESQATEAEYA